MADNPQQTARELKDLVVAYAKQEATDPLKGLLRYVGWGLAGALLMGTGAGFLAVGVLRLLQGNRGWFFHGDWSFTPYLIDVVALSLVAGLVWMARKKRNNSTKRSSKP